ncbi:porin family protein [Seonamhaeicola marinus]|uniref:PorT family protein n=1 Tax=Seonamhaeicola marinus TaxID=1912246 RepID=A0A5D0HXA8_9FLAO|nr:hypothetical protein [Seonamhaeicola marinus]TYA74082.1 hypothetical protein FUA24_12095 [Seonamhaeicola marinus]
MSDKKHIDRLFQERFKDFEAAPSDAVWKNIEANLNNKKKKRRVIPIWWRYAGVAALLLLLLTVGGVFNGNDGQKPIEVVDTENQPSNSTNNAASETPDKLNTSTKNVVSNAQEEQDHINETNEIEPEEKPTYAKSNGSTLVTTNSSSSTSTTKNESKTHEDANLNKNNAAIVNKTSKEFDKTPNEPSKGLVANNVTKQKQNEDSSNTLANNNGKPQNNTFLENKVEEVAKTKTEENKDLTIEEALENNKELIENTKKLKRWTLAANAAPVYFNTLDQGSSLGPGFVNNSKSGEVNMSYGLAATYALSHKLKIRSGVNRVNLGYNTNNVIELRTAGFSANRSSFSNLDGVSVESNNDNIASDGNVSIVSGANLSNVPESLNSTSTTLNQAFGYIEVPVELQYAISTRKFGVNVIGGFSSFFLNNNSIFSESETGTRTFLGEASNLNKISYSANFGLGFNYKFTEKIDLNLEPMFKYQINTFNNTSGNFTPFIIGVYTGFAIKF